MSSFYEYFFNGAKDGSKTTWDVKASDDPHHMERYHPHGFDPSKDKCVLVDRDKGVDALSSARFPIDSDSPHYYEEISRGVSLPEMERWIKNNCGGGTKCLFARTYSDFNAKDSWKRIGQSLDYKGDYVSQEGFENACRSFYEVAHDLRQRYGKLALDIDLFIPFNFDNGALGVASLDKRQGISYVSIVGNPELYNYPNGGFHHKDNRMINDVVRHEIGHTRSTREVLATAKTIMAAFIHQHGIEYVANGLYHSIGLNAAYPYLMVLGKEYNMDSKQYELDFEDTLAELFSFVTSPEYKTGTLPKEMEHIVEVMIGEEKKEIQDTFCLDEIESPSPKTEIEKLENLHETLEFSITKGGEGNTQYGKWDDRSGKWRQCNQYTINLIKAIKNGEVGSREKKPWGNCVP